MPQAEHRAAGASPSSPLGCMAGDELSVSPGKGCSQGRGGCCCSRGAGHPAGMPPGALLGEVLAVPVPTLPARHGRPWVLSRTTQGDSPSLLPRSPCLANVLWCVPSTAACGWRGPGAAASQACSSL